MMTLDDIKVLVATYKYENGNLDWDNFYEPWGATYEGQVIPKQRARTTKSGHTFTPTKTREFEKKVKEWGKKHLNTPVTFPLSVSLTFFDLAKDSETLTYNNITYRQHGDVDNRAKAVLDGLNKIAYKDDKQIVQLYIERRWSTMEGFTITLQRAGLSASEYDTFLKVMRAQNGK